MRIGQKIELNTEETKELFKSVRYAIQWICITIISVRLLYLLCLKMSVITEVDISMGMLIIKLMGLVG
jgi:hypothetical protein